MFRLSAVIAPKIEFLCAPEDLGVIPEPLRMRDLPLDGYRELPLRAGARMPFYDRKLVARSCPSFREAMKIGWVLSLAARVRLQIRDQGRTINAESDGERVLVSKHHIYQMTGDSAPVNPPCQFHNYWTIRTPKGWSCLFLPLLNRPGGVFEVAAGVVDTDEHNSPIHFPFFATAEDGDYALDKGTPLVQVVPFLRANTEIEASIRVETSTESQLREHLRLATAADKGCQRKEAWPAWAC